MPPQRSSTRYLRFTANSAASPQRCLLLERLLARADASVPVDDWRADAFRVIASPGALMPGVAAAALYADCGAVPGATAFIATPVHYVAEMNNVRLSAAGVLSLSASEALALARDFDRLWQDAGIRLLAGRGGALYCVTDRPLPATTQDPQQIQGRHIADHLPAGPAAPRLRQLMSEIEMWLFDHPVNRARAAAAQPAVNGLWLWGGGAALASLPPLEGWTAGDDLYFKALGAGMPEERASLGSGVVVIGAAPGTARWGDAESRWLERSAADLRARRIAGIAFSSGNRRFRVNARSRWRFWRARRPWWEYFT
jgi:hypothetical protein